MEFELTFDMGMDYKSSAHTSLLIEFQPHNLLLLLVTSNDIKTMATC